VLRRDERGNHDPSPAKRGGCCGDGATAGDASAGHVCSPRVRKGFDTIYVYICVVYVYMYIYNVCSICIYVYILS